MVLTIILVVSLPVPVSAQELLIVHIIDYFNFQTSPFLLKFAQISSHNGSSSTSQRSPSAQAVISKVSTTTSTNITTTNALRIDITPDESEHKKRGDTDDAATERKHSKMLDYSRYRRMIYRIEDYNR